MVSLGDIGRILRPTIPKIGGGPTISETIKAFKSPSGTASGFTPVLDPSGRVADARRTGGGTPRGGGGGGGSFNGRPSGPSGPSGPSAADLARIESDRRAAETARLQREQAARDRETARQERIEMGTIGGQLERDTGTIDVFRSEDFSPDKRFKRGAFETVGAFFKETGRDIGIIGFGLLAGRDIKGLRDPFNVFEFAGKQKGEQIIIKPQFGTVDLLAPPGKTLFQLQEQSQREAGIPEIAIGRSPGFQAAAIGQQESGRITQKFQEQIDLGQIGLEEAETQAGQEFQDVFFERTGRIRADDLTVRSGKLFGDVARQVAITAVVLGASAFSPAIAGAVGGTSIAAAGQLSARAGQEFFRGEFLQSGVSLGQSALFGFGGASLIGGALGPTGTIPRSITAGRIAELQAKPVKLLGVEFVVDSKQSVSVVGGLRQTSTARQQLEFLIPTFKTGTTAAGRTKASIVGGRVISRTQVQSFGLQGLVPKGQDILKFTEAISFTGRGVSGLPASTTRLQSGLKISTSLGDDITGGFGKLDLIRGDLRTTTDFSGISKIDGKVTSVVTGRPGTETFTEVLRVTEKELIGTSRTTFFGGSPSSISFKPQSFGKILKVDLSKTLGVVSKQIGFKGGGAGTSLIQKQVSELGGTGLQAATKISQVIKPTVDLGFKSSVSVGSLTFTQRQFGDIGRQFGQQSIFTGQLVQPTTKQLSSTLTIPTQREILKLSGRQITGFTSISALDIRSGQVSATDTIQLLKQPLKLKQKQVSSFRGFDPIFTPSFIGGFETGFGGGLPLPPLIFPTFRSGGRRQRGIKLRERIAPSLTGLVVFDIGGITGGPLKLSGRFGRSPADIRFVPESLVGTRRQDFSFGGFLGQPVGRKRKLTKRKKK